jgi:hypothetical protein
MCFEWLSRSVYGNHTNIFKMSFSLSNVMNIVSTIDDVLLMRESPSTINASTGYEEDDNDAEFIKFIFDLSNGILHIKFYEYIGVITYESKDGEILKSIEFRDSSDLKYLQKFARKIRAFDRNQPSKAKLTPIDRASFGLVEVN